MSKKIVLITGTNSGFGWLTANSVAALGHKVYATMRDTNGKNADKAKALAQVKNITVLDVTLTDDISVKAAFDTIITKEGTIDVLVNNAGIGVMGVTESYSVADVQDVFDVNVITPFRLMKLALPSMREKSEGLIINITSGFGRISFPFSAVYSASKFGLEGLSEGMHYEVRPLGIDVAIIEPGAFPTEMGQKSKPASDATTTGGYKELLTVYSNKMGSAVGQIFETLKPNPQDVADAVVDLINLPKGERPLRTVVDPTTGKFVKKVNEATAVEYANGMEAFGMKDLLV